MEWRLLFLATTPANIPWTLLVSVAAALASACSAVMAWRAYRLNTIASERTLAEKYMSQYDGAVMRDAHKILTEIMKPSSNPRYRPQSLVAAIDAARAKQHSKEPLNTEEEFVLKVEDARREFKSYFFSATRLRMHDYVEDKFLSLVYMRWGLLAFFRVVQVLEAAKSLQTGRADDEPYRHLWKHCDSNRGELQAIKVEFAKLPSWEHAMEQARSNTEFAPP